MFRSKAIPLCSVISLGIGAYIGRNFDRLTSVVDHEVGSQLADYLPLPAVSASSRILAPDDSKNLPAAAPPATNRVSEIMRFGFPGLTDVRTYEDFVLSYDRRNRTAMWVFEHLTPDRFNYASDVDRSKSQFQEDVSVHEYFRATNADYKNSGYDRGHLAAASNHRNSQKAIDQTFLLSNISPQVGEGFNRDAWNDLEKYTRAVARKNKNVYVCTGPLYLPRREPDGKLYIKYEVIGKNNVAVPTHFFKVLLIEDEGGKFELQSFVMPNAVLPKDVPLKAYLQPLDSIERAAGLLLFSQLPKKMLSKVNGKKV